MVIIKGCVGYFFIKPHTTTTTTLSVLMTIFYHNHTFRVVISVDKKLVSGHMERLQNSKHKRLVVDEDSLRWTPLVSSQSLMEEEKQTEHEVTYFVLISRLSFGLNHGHSPSSLESRAFVSYTCISRSNYDSVT